MRRNKMKLELYHTKKLLEMLDLYLGREGGGKFAPFPQWPHTSPLTKTMLAQNFTQAPVSTAAACAVGKLYCLGAPYRKSV
jgi:hypothetical protein